MSHTLFNLDCIMPRMIHASLYFAVELWHPKILINESAVLELLLIEYLLAVHRTERSVVWTTQIGLHTSDLPLVINLPTQLTRTKTDVHCFTLVYEQHVSVELNSVIFLFDILNFVGQLRLLRLFNETFQLWWLCCVKWQITREWSYSYHAV